MMDAAENSTCLTSLKLSRGEPGTAGVEIVTDFNVSPSVETIPMRAKSVFGPATPVKGIVPLIPLLSVQVTSTMPVNPLLSSWPRNEKSLNSISFAGVKVRELRISAPLGLMVEKPAPVSTAPVVSTVNAVPSSMPVNVVTALLAASMENFVPPAHFDTPQLVSMTNVACAGTEASANPPARANGVKNRREFLAMTPPPKELRWNGNCSNRQRTYNPEVAPQRQACQ